MLPGLSVATPHKERGKSLSSSSYKATGPIGLGPHPEDSLNLNYLLKMLPPKSVPRELGLQYMNLGGGGGQDSVHSKLQGP